MPDWRIHYSHITIPVAAGTLEQRLAALSAEAGIREFTVTAAALRPALAREVPDTIPEEWA